MRTVALINPGDRSAVFQSLGSEIAAIEPPYWIAAQAAFLRNRGVETLVIDANAESLSPDDTAARAAAADPLLTVVVVYGSQPSASTQNMPAAGKICSALRKAGIRNIALSGLHPSALPRRTLQEESVDFVIQGEGPATYLALIKALETTPTQLERVPGLWWMEAGSPRCTGPAPLFENLDELLPTAAWDLLPMRSYRAHNWHCFGNSLSRSPYAAIYTSLGCPFNCNFCCVNTPFGGPGIRYRSPKAVLEEIELLAGRFDIRNLKIIDELFILKEAHYLPILQGLRDLRLGMNIWAYARVDTVRKKHLALLREAGVSWLALGIESADPRVRDGAEKKMRVQDVARTVRDIQNEGIHVIANFIFGLPGDDLRSMKATLDMALDLNCEFANFYCAMAYPGSRLYNAAIEEGWPLPPSWNAYSQHSFDCLPLPTRALSAAQVLQFRDNAFHAYFENPRYLESIECKFGAEIRAHVAAMTRMRLKRKLFDLEHPIAK